MLEDRVGDSGGGDGGGDFVDAEDVGSVEDSGGVCGGGAIQVLFKEGFAG